MILPKYITLICGNLFVGAGIGLYVSTNLCAAPQEAFVLTVAEKKKWTFRTESFSNYKANRAAPPEELIPQFDSVLNVVLPISQHVTICVGSIACVAVNKCFI